MNTHYLLCQYYWNNCFLHATILFMNKCRKNNLVERNNSNRYTISQEILEYINSLFIFWVQAAEVLFWFLLVVDLVMVLLVEVLEEVLVEVLTEVYQLEEAVGLLLFLLENLELKRVYFSRWKTALAALEATSSALAVPIGQESSARPR